MATVLEHVNTTREGDGDPVRTPIATLENYEFTKDIVAQITNSEGYIENAEALLVLGPGLPNGAVIKETDTDDATFEQLFRVVQKRQGRSGRTQYLLQKVEKK